MGTRRQHPANPLAAAGVRAEVDAVGLLNLLFPAFDLSVMPLKKAGRAVE
jgi:hypothetical protein